MAQARIEMNRAMKPQMADISAAILRGMVRGLGMGADDLFQTFRLHDEGELVFDPHYPNANRTDIIYIEIVASPVFNDDQKRAGMVAVADEVEALGIKRDNLLLNFLDLGTGAWYAPGTAK